MKKQELAYHLHCREGDVGRYCLLPGDPGRVPMLADLLDEPREIAYNREFRVMTGSLLGRAVTVCSTGIGGPSCAIAVEELHELGADTFLRVGTCGGIDTSVMPGDLLIPTGAIRFEHTSREYAPIEFPAVPDFGVTAALVDAAERNGAPCHLGVVQCKDSFYGQHRPETMPVGDELLRLWRAWKNLGVKGSEMESAALFVISSALGCRAGAILHTVWNQEREASGQDTPPASDVSRACRVAVDALREIIRSDERHD